MTVELKQTSLNPFSWQYLLICSTIIVFSLFIFVLVEDFLILFKNILHFPATFVGKFSYNIIWIVTILHSSYILRFLSMVIDSVFLSLIVYVHVEIRLLLSPVSLGPSHILKRSIAQ